MDATRMRETDAGLIAFEVVLTRLTDINHQGFVPGRMSAHGEHGKKPRRRPSFVSEFKAKIVELCQRGDRSVGQVTKDLDLTETAVREWVKQAERDTGTRDDGGLASSERVDRCTRTGAEQVIAPSTYSAYG